MVLYHITENVQFGTCECHHTSLDQIVEFFTRVSSTSVTEYMQTESCFRRAAPVNPLRGLPGKERLILCPGIALGINSCTTISKAFATKSGAGVLKMVKSTVAGMEIDLLLRRCYCCMLLASFLAASSAAIAAA